MAGVPTIPGWNNPRVEFTKVSESNHCCKCDRMLYQPMQTACGHKLCSPCLDEILAVSNDADCPGKDETCEAINRYNVYPDFAIFREMSRMEVYCPNKDIGCPEKFRNTEVQNHLEKCQYKKLACTVEGCKFQGSASSLKDHLASATADHVVLLNQTVRTKNIVFKDDIRSLQEKREEMKRERQAVRDEHRQEVEALNARIDQLETKVREEKEASTNTLAEVQRQMEEQRSAVQRMSIQMDRNNTKVREEKEASTNTLAEVQRQMEEQRSALQRMSIQVDRNNKLIQMNSNSRSTGIPVPATQNTAYHIAYHWQITNYSARKHNEINGLTQFLDSEPFYCGGYKMCMRVYFFGDGIGKGTHMSLYMSILNGENDDSLKWPFSHRISMVLLNPHNPNQKVVQEQFDPVPTSASYHKPKTARNKGTGFPLFAPHSVVESAECLVDNTLQVLMLVDSSILETVRE